MYDNHSKSRHFYMGVPSPPPPPPPREVNSRASGFHSDSLWKPHYRLTVSLKDLRAYSIDIIADTLSFSTLYLFSSFSLSFLSFTRWRKPTALGSWRMLYVSSLLLFSSRRKHMPSVTYLRLDGSTPAGSRHSLVQRQVQYNPVILFFILYLAVILSF